ncbi:epithelial discoidin domain-containing receptor 1-like isoform X1 [Rhopilema esculentum]|uniref:epithelial discoidin domain-containing receptor 1-like isoform X1 n=2 Tax=Rhopilema esculentum TaxID=499914 RepID=UPI0031D9C6C0
MEYRRRKETEQSLSEKLNMALAITFVTSLVLLTADSGSAVLFNSCLRKLGVSNSSIVRDSQITASSYLYGERKAIYHFKPYFARLHTHGGGGAWCSSNTNVGQYIQVDFLRNLRINYLQTQGRYRGAEFVEKYRLQYQRSTDAQWRSITDNSGREKIFHGNNDTDTVAGNRLPHTIIARRVRLFPTGDYFSIHCLRMEMYGCSYDNAYLVSYSAPVGIKIGKFDFTDRSYDGNYVNKSKMLQDGLGDLVDEYYGSNDLQTGWVGYNLSTVVLTFKFSKFQSFSSFILETRTLARTDVLLKSVEIMASIDGRKYFSVKKVSEVMKQKSGNKLTVNINVYSAKFIRCKLVRKIPKDIILISEVSFLKGPPRKPTTTQKPTTSSAKTEPKSTRITRKQSTYPRVLSSKYTKEVKIFSHQGTENRSLATIFSSEDAKAAQPRGGSKRTKSFYIILGIGTSVAAIFTLMIIMLICFLRREKSDGKVAKKFNHGKRGSDATKVSEPLLKNTEFQGTCGTSKYIGPEIVVVSGFPSEREISRAAVEFENKIGGGKFGEVFIGQVICPRDDSLSASVHNLVGQKVFIEMLRKGASVEISTQLLDEIRALSCLRHPNICRLIAVCTKSEPKFLLSECLEGMRLDSYLASLNQTTNTRKGEILADIVVKVASALKYLASMKYVHRDISSRNVLFGVGNIVKLTNTAAACPGYYDCYCYLKEKGGLHPIRWMAPETLDDSCCSVQSDVWSFGVLLWEIYTFAKVIPFERLGNIQVLDRLKALFKEGSGNVEYLPLKFLNCPTLIIQVMLRSWYVSPGQRITADEIYELLTR